ncbi:GntR family transcriptional regulator [Pararobbsia silviterrae]|uniref:GntR family transcriptional regulator n=1 Tax=Pararobbsia silviterrae TaxID=1792498 RepID=A0A494Y7J3_9BURK|nr:GntR family transcriptional regulator [Pararobbsia silviterrae]RKP58679.1 GntR family transcriptional regulator [Pararobbsia silviterrae]
METLSEQVTEKLRDAVLHGRYKPGERIEEIPTALAMGVSRTPVRAALAALVNQGLIVHQAKRGYVVREFDIDVIVSAYEVRGVLEGLACKSAALRGVSEADAQVLKDCLAVGDRILAKGALEPEDREPYQKMNVDLHNTLIDASGNPWLDRFGEQARNIPYASDRIVLWEVGHAVILRSHDDHHRIVAAVLERDGGRAEQLMREHVYYSGIIFKNNYDRRMNPVNAVDPVSAVSI